ncbi:sulfide:quinone oxidoreductase, mitochondrial [Lingula anatina]|uniref:Sulfide:quinone oxidoreductase, mitochondrial n=1 Tax=Lingula anatina TaxID=7574 RepID=A0A1S3JG43_LINAN|nr:sulfide:quinone oxidoreductase, mitochondrial [Lingula anatina]|eukprot:XP_013409111.1 sulfide:quinone oxidoreductase, mitochondrial [Lingula anatina]
MAAAGKLFSGRFQLLKSLNHHSSAKFSTGRHLCAQKSYELLIVGGGTGGTVIANKFAPKLGSGKVAVIEPSDTHYYQPMWTLVGGGIKTLEDSSRPTKNVLPKQCDWIKQKAASFDPHKCTVTTDNGDEIKYQYLVVAMGIQLNYNKIKGLPEAFDEDPMLTSNYSTDYVTKTYKALNEFQAGNAIFTFPNTPIKCAGAPQKIMYLAEERFRQRGVRDKATVMFNTSLGVIFGVKKYADALLKVIEKRDIKVNYKKNLIEVRPGKKEAVFENLDSTTGLGETQTVQYSFMHITPPMSAPDVLRNSPLVDQSGFVNVNKNTLQHVEFSNVFGIGDCTNVPTSKTAAAISGQCGVLRKNLWEVMQGREPEKEYNGYTSCPLITGYKSCILAEFDFAGNPLETFPINQGVERRSMFHMKKDVMPQMYWKFLLNGYWEGPDIPRKIMHLGLSQ